MKTMVWQWRTFSIATAIFTGMVLCGTVNAQNATGNGQRSATSPIPRYVPRHLRQNQQTPEQAPGNFAAAPVAKPIGTGAAPPVQSNGQIALSSYQQFVGEGGYVEDGFVQDGFVQHGGINGDGCGCGNGGCGNIGYGGCGNGGGGIFGWGILGSRNGGCGGGCGDFGCAGGCSDGCSGGGCSDGGCCGGGGCGRNVDPCCCLFRLIDPSRIQAFAGVHGYTGSANLGSAGSFGFHEGINYGNRLPCLLNGQISMQFGFNATQSNFEGGGAIPGVGAIDDSRNQFFVTGGFFRRVDWGIQGGLVVDYLHDEWYTESNIMQLRGEVSWVYPGGSEIGFHATSGYDDDVATTGQINNVNFQFNTRAVDTYQFFFRRQLCGGGNVRVSAGWTEDSDGLIGAEVLQPLGQSFALRSSFTYLAPDGVQNQGGRLPLPDSANENWNVGISLIWYPGSFGRINRDYHRPLFNVADNGSLIYKRNGF